MTKSLHKRRKQETSATGSRLLNDVGQIYPTLNFKNCSLTLIVVFVSENGDGPDTPSGPAISPAHLDETAQGSPGVIQTFQTSPVRASLSPVQTKSPTRMSRTLPSPHPSSETAHGRSPRNSISAHSNHFSPPQAQRSLSGQHGSPMTANDPSSPLTTVADHHCRRLNSRIESMLLQNFVKELASWVGVLGRLRCCVC